MSVSAPNQPIVPKVSVIVPAYNREHYIGKAIDSVRAQTFRDWELIIADDGSTDRTCAIVESYQDSRIKLLRSQINRGAGAARNRALQAASGEYIAFLDSDDYWLEGKLDCQVRLLDGMPEAVGMLYGDELYEHEDGRVTRYRFGGIRPFTGHAFYQLANRFIVRTSTVMARRSLLSRLQWFDESILSGQDYEFFVRVAHECEVYPIEQPLTVHRLHKTSLRQDVSKAGPHQIRAAYKIKTTFNVPARRMARTLARCHQEFALYLLNEGNVSEARNHFLKAFFFQPKLLRSAFLCLLCSFEGRPYRRYQALRGRT